MRTNLTQAESARRVGVCPRPPEAARGRRPHAPSLMWLTGETATVYDCYAKLAQYFQVRSTTAVRAAWRAGLTVGVADEQGFQDRHLLLREVPGDCAPHIRRGWRNESQPSLGLDS